MARSRSAVVLLLVVVIVCRHCLAQGGCRPSPPEGLVVPEVSSPDLRPQIGRCGTKSWAVFSATQVETFGLWCQVRVNETAGMGSNIGDWYYPTTGNTSDGSTLLPNTTDDNAPYQSLKCTNQIGLVVDGNVTNNQGIVKCSTTVPNLSREANYFGVYSDNFFNDYTGPMVDENMTLSLLSPRDSDPRIMFTLSFNVSYGAPSWIRCTYGNNVEVISGRNPEPGLVREVIRSHYVNISQPDKTRVNVTLTAPREERTCTCNVTVERFSNLCKFSSMGNGISTASITVAGTPTAVTANKTGSNSVLVSWTAPSPAPAGYEVFYHLITEDSGPSKEIINNTELTLTGLMDRHTYIIFVVAFGAIGTPVFPSARSNKVMITIEPLEPPSEFSLRVVMVISLLLAECVVVTFVAIVVGVRKLRHLLSGRKSRRPSQDTSEVVLTNQPKTQTKGGDMEMTESVANDEYYTPPPRQRTLSFIEYEEYPLH